MDIAPRAPPKTAPAHTARRACLQAPPWPAPWRAPPLCPRPALPFFWP